MDDYVIFLRILCNPNLILLEALKEGWAKNIRFRTNLMFEGRLGSVGDFRKGPLPGRCFAGALSLGG